MTEEPWLEDLKAEYKEMQRRLEAIETLMRDHPSITVLHSGQYSIMPMMPSDGDKIAKAIMAILFPDERERGSEIIF